MVATQEQIHGYVGANDHPFEFMILCTADEAQARGFRRGSRELRGLCMHNYAPDTVSGLVLHKAVDSELLHRAIEIRIRPYEEVS